MNKKSKLSLKILLPFGVFAIEDHLETMVVETTAGSFGILSQRMDCVAALDPGILVYSHAQGEPSYVAVDRGILIKYGSQVTVSVRNAIKGLDLKSLQETVKQEFLVLNQDQVILKGVMEKMQTAFIQNLSAISHE